MNIDAKDGYGVVAEYADMAAARRAIDALQFGGVEATRIALLGEAAESARRADAQRNMAGRDTPLMWRIIWRGFLWSIVGGVLGVALGLVFGLLGVGLPGYGGSLGIQIASWAMFAHVAGALWGAYAAISSGDAWEATFQSGPTGPVVIGVRTDDPREIERSARILREKQANSVSLRRAG